MEKTVRVWCKYGLPDEAQIERVTENLTAKGWQLIERCEVGPAFWALVRRRRMNGETVLTFKRADGR
jgi:hypothetical protein